MSAAGEGVNMPNENEIKARYDAATQMVSDLDQRKREWIMSIPARRDYDPDLVIAASLADVPRLQEQLRVAREALMVARTRMAHRMECASINDTSEWVKCGSWNFIECTCELKIVSQALAAIDKESK